MLALEYPKLTFQVAAGILIASLVLAVVAVGLKIAFDPDNRNLGTSGSGYWIAGTGLLVALAIIYKAVAG